MTQITVLYFGPLQELRGAVREIVAGEISDVASLRRLLSDRYAWFRERNASIRMARNEVFALDAESVSNGDTIALIPPVAGG